MDITVTKKDVKNSLDARWIKMRIWLFSSPLILYIVQLFQEIKKFKKEGLELNILKLIFNLFDSFTGILLVIILLIVFYEIKIYFRLFKKINCYEVVEIKLTKAQLSHFHIRFHYFTIRFNTKNKKIFIRDTRRMFSDRYWFTFSLGDYLERTVRIAYNQETDTLIILNYNEPVM